MCRGLKLKLRKFVLGKPFTISVPDNSLFRVGSRFWYGDTPLRILAIDGSNLSVVRAQTFKQWLAKLFVRMLEWSPRQQVLERLYQAQGEPGRAQSRYERPVGRYSRGPRT